MEKQITISYSEYTMLQEQQKRLKEKERQLEQVIGNIEGRIRYYDDRFQQHLEYQTENSEKLVNSFRREIEMLKRLTEVTQQKEVVHTTRLIK